MKGVYADVIKWHGNACVDGPEREGRREAVMFLSFALLDFNLVLSPMRVGKTWTQRKYCGNMDCVFVSWDVLIDAVVSSAT